MSKIKKIIGRQIFDSRGNPTIEVDILLKMAVSEGHQFLLELLQAHMKLMSLGMEKKLYQEKQY